MPDRSLMRAVIDTIWPKGSAWNVAPDEDLDKLLDGSAENWEEVRVFLSELSEIRTPATTPFLADLEREYGVFTNPNLTEQQRRDQLTPVVYGQDSNGSVDALQGALDAAGFTVQVHENSPAVDPALFLDQDFQMVAAGFNSFAGRSDAFAGKIGGELLVNGEIFRTRKIVSSVAGTFYAGDGTTAGEYTDLERTEITYNIPTDSTDWPLVFFVGGDATRRGLGDFEALGQTLRGWGSMISHASGDVYASVFNGDIYKQTSGLGDFIALGQTLRSWNGLASTISGDVYSCVNGGDIYKQTSGLGNFIALGQTSRSWNGMTATPTGDVYAGDSGGDIYKQTSGLGNFVALGQTSRSWTDMTVTPSGDVYACVQSGDIYKQTSGLGDFIALNQTSRSWQGMTATPTGDVYASAFNGDIYKQTSGLGDFIALNQTSRRWEGMAATISGDVYAAVNNGDIYKRIVTDGVTGEITGIQLATVPIEQEGEFKRLILKYKPIHSWAGLIIEFV